MKINIISVGKIKDKYLKEGINEYKKRISKFCDINIIEVDDEEIPIKTSKTQENIIKKKEAERILKKINPNSIVITLEIAGEKFSSQDFASKLNSHFILGNSQITFIIGGSIGIHDELSKIAHLKLSFSDFTFTHQLIRLLLLEQIYRAFKIINGETYHK